MSLLRDNERDRLRRLLDTLERDLAAAPERRVSPGKRQRPATGRRPLDQPRRSADRVPAAGKRAMTASLEADFSRAAAEPDWSAVIAGSPLGPGAMARPARATPAPDRNQEPSEDSGNDRPGRRRRGAGDEQAATGNQSRRGELDAVAATGQQAAADGMRAADMLARFGGPMAQAADQLRSISGQLSATLSGELETLRATLETAPGPETAASPETEPAAVAAEVEAVQRDGAAAASAATSDAAADAETAAELDATIADAEATAEAAEADAAEAEAGAEGAAEGADATGEAAADEAAAPGQSEGEQQAGAEGAAGGPEQAAQGDPAAAGSPDESAGPGAEQHQQAQQEQQESSPADGEVRITSISKADAEAAMATDAAGQAGAEGAAATGEVTSDGGVSRGAGSSGRLPRLERPSFQPPQMPTWQPRADPSARAAAMGEELGAAASQPVEINPPPVRSAPPSLDAGADLQQEPVRVEVHSNTQLPQLGDVEGGAGAAAALTASPPPPAPDPARIAGNGPAARAAAAVVGGGAISQAVDGVSSEFQGEIEGNASAAATEQVAGVGGGFQPTGRAEAAGGARMAASSAAAAGARGADPVLPAAEHPVVPAAPAIGGGGGGGGAAIAPAPAVDTSIPAAQLPAANQPAMPASAGGPGAARTGGDLGAAPEVPAVSDYSSEENIPDASSLAPSSNVSMAENSSAAQSSIDAESATGNEVGPEAQSQISGEVAPLAGEMQSTYSAESGPPRSAAMSAHSGQASAAAADGEAALSGEQSNVSAQAAVHDQQIAAQHSGAAALPEPGTLAASRSLTYGDHAQAQMAGVGAPVSQPMGVPAGARAMGQSGQSLAGDAAARQPNLARMGEVDRRPEFPELDASAAESTRGQIDRVADSGRQAMANLPTRPLQMGGPAAAGVSSAPAGGGAAAGAAGAGAGAARAGGGSGGPGGAGPNPAQQEAARQAAIGRVEAGVSGDVSAQGPATMQASAAPRVAEAEQLLSSRQQVLGQHVGDAQSRAQDQWSSTVNAPPAVTSADASRAAEQAWSPHQAEANRALATMNSDIAAAETNAEGQHQAAIGQRNASAAAAHAGMTAAIAGVNAGFTSAQASAESGYQAERQTAQGEFESAGQQAQAAAQQGYQQAQQQADTGYQQAQQQMESDAQAAEQSATSEQEAARTQADADRQQLQGEMDSQVQSEIGRMNSEVDAAAQQGQAEIDGHLAQGEANAAREIEAGIAQAESEEAAARAEVEANEAELERKRQEEAEERNNRSGVGKVTGWIKDRASDALNAIKSAIDSLVNAIKSIISAVCDAIVSVLRAARDLAMAALDAARDLALAALEAVKNLIQGLISAIASALRAFISLVADAIRAVVSALADALSFIIEALETVLNTIIEAAQFAFNAVLDGFIGLVSLVDEDLGQALDDATQGFQDRVNSAADGLQENISAASDAAQQGVQVAADTVNAGVTAAEENAIATVNTVEEGLHTAVEVAYEAGVAVTNAAFDAAEFAVEAATDIAIAAVELGAQVALTGLSLTQAAMHGDMDMAMEALNDLGDAVSNVGAAIVENIPGPIKEAFIDFWNSQWRDMIIGGLIAVGAGLLIATGVGAIAVIAIGAAVGAATYGGGELLAQEATQDLHEETGAIYVAGQGYITPQVGEDGAIRFVNENGEEIGGYVDAQGNPVPPGTPGAQLALPDGVDPTNYEWAIRNFNIDESGDVSEREGHELMGYVGSEALEGAIQGGMSAASAVGGARAGAFLASRFGGVGANVLLRGGASAVDDVARVGAQGIDDVARVGAQSAFRTRVLGGVGEAGVDMATSSIQQGGVQMVETYERTGDLGQAWDVGYRSAQQGLTSPTALITSMVMVGGTSAQARFLDDLGFMQNPGVRQAVDTALETGYETGGGVVGEGGMAFYGALRDGQSVSDALGAAQTAAGQQLAPEQLLFNLTMNGLGNYGGSFAERRYQEGAIDPANGYPSGRPEGGDSDSGGSTTRQTEGGTVTEIDTSRPRDQGDAPPAGGSTTRPGQGGDVTILGGGGTTTRPDGSTVRPDGTVTRPDGTTVRPDGTTTRPGEGGDVTELGSTRPRDQDDDGSRPRQDDGAPAPDGTVPDPSLRADEFDPSTLRDADATNPQIQDTSRIGAYANLATSRDGIALLSMPEGRALIGTNEGRALLGTPAGRDLLMSPEGRALLRSPEGQAVLLSPAGQQFLMSSRGQELMATPGGRELLFTADGQRMLANPETRALLNDPTAVRLMTFEGGPAFLQSENGQLLIHSTMGQDLINKPAFADLMALPEGRAMLDDPDGVLFLMGPGAQMLDSPRGRVLLTTPEGQAQFRSPEGQRLFNSTEGRIRLAELGGPKVLDDPGMYQLLMTPEGQQVVFSPDFNSFVDSRRTDNGLILATQPHVLVDRPIGTEPGVDPIQRGRELLGRLRDGDRTALADLGVDLPPDFDVASVEWGLARMSDGSVHLMRGDSGSVSPNRVAGAQDLVSHSHPLVADRTIETPRPIGDILSDPSQNYLLFPSGATGDIGYIYRSFQLEGFAGGPRVTEHTIHLPYQFLGRDSSGQPIIGQGDGVQPGPSARPADSAPSIEAVITETPRIVGYMPEPQGEGQPPILHPIYATSVSYRAGDEVLHSGEFYTYSSPSVPGGHYSSFSDIMPGAVQTNNASVDQTFAQLGYGPMVGSHDGLDVFRTPNTPVGRTHRDRAVVEAAAQKLARGDRSGFTDLGMTSQFNPPDGHWMIGQWPDGTYGVIRGDRNGIPLQSMPDGVTPIAAIRGGDGSVFDIPPQQQSTQPTPGPGPEGVTGRGDGQSTTGAQHPPGSTQHILHPDGSTEVRPLTNPDGSAVRNDTPADLTPILSGMDEGARTRAETVLSTMEPQARSDFEALARLQQDGRIRGMEGWLEFVSRTDQSPDYLANVSHELSIARQLAESGPPGRVVDLGADGEGVFDPLTARRLPTYDIRVQDPGGPVREIEIKSVQEPVTQVSHIGGAVGEAMGKLRTRDEAGMPIENPELVVRMDMGESRTPRPGNATDVVGPDGSRYRQLQDGRIIEQTNLFDQVPDYLANVETQGRGRRGEVSQDGPALQRVVLQSNDGTVLATYERTPDAWVRVDDSPPLDAPRADSDDSTIRAETPPSDAEVRPDELAPDPAEQPAAPLSADWQDFIVRREGYSENDAAGEQYGRRAAQAVDDANAMIARGELQTMQDVMDFFAQRRSDIARDMGDGDADQFGRRRTDDPNMYSTTPIRGERYGHVADRLPERLRPIQVTLPDGTTVDLTMIAPGGIFGRGEGDVWVHTSGQNIDVAMDQAAQLYQRALDPSLSPAETMRVVGEMHWWLAHAMPYERGSAAVSDMMVRSILAQRGIEAGPRPQGVVPDVEALVTSDPQAFADRYASMFEGGPGGDAGTAAQPGGPRPDDGDQGGAQALPQGEQASSQRRGDEGGEQSPDSIPFLDDTDVTEVAGPPPLPAASVTPELRAEWTQRVAADPDSMDNAPPALRGDREFMLAATSRDHRAIRHADPALFSDPQFRRDALNANNMTAFGIYRARPDLFQDPATVLEMAAHSPDVAWAMSHNNNPLLADPDFAAQLIAVSPRSMQHLPEGIRSNEQVIAAGLASDQAWPILRTADPAILLREPSLSRIQEGVESGRIPSHWLTNDLLTSNAILPSALVRDSRLVSRADVVDALRRDPELARESVDRNPMIYSELPRDVRRRLRREAPDTVQRAEEFQSQLDELGMAGISERASSIDNVRELIRNRTEAGDDDPRPLAIVMYPTAESDHNGAFRNTEVENLMRHYRVVYVEPGSNRNILPELQGITGLANRQAEVLVVAGHGMRTSTQIAGNPWLLGGLWPGQNVSTGNEGMLQRGGFGDFIAPDGHIVLESCSTGKGGADKNNMANMFSRLAPHANVHAPTVDGNNTFQYGPNGEFIRPDYYGIERHGWPWNRRTEINRDPSVYYHVDAQHGAAMQPEGSSALHDAAQPDGATQPFGFDELASDSDTGGQPRSASPWSGMFGSMAGGPRADQPTVGDGSTMDVRADGGPAPDQSTITPEGAQAQIALPPGDPQGDSTMQRSPVMDMDTSPMGMGGVNRIFLARDADGNEFVVKARRQENFPYSAVDEEIEGIRMMEALGGPRYLGEVRFYEDGIWIEGIAMEKVNGVDLALAQTAEGRPEFDIDHAHHSDLDRVFDWYVEQGVLPFDLQAGNFMATRDGLVPIDAPMMLPASPAEIAEARRSMHELLDRIRSGQGEAAPNAAGSGEWFTGSPVPESVFEAGE